MGQKVNPKAYRIGITRTWNSKWFSDKNYKEFLQEDIMIRKVVANKLKNSGVADIDIERYGDSIKVIVNAAKPGLIIGRGGAGIDQLKQEIVRKVFDKIYKSHCFLGSNVKHDPNPPKRKYDLDISIKEIKDAGLSAQVVLEEMTLDIEKRVKFKRVMKQAMERVKKAGAKGVKISVAGRLGGVDIARTEKASWGNIPLHTLRADIEYSRGVARTIYGAIGIKVWIYRGDVFKEKIIDREKELNIENQKIKNNK